MRAAGIALALSGAAHLIITPEHFSHAPAHGLFFAVIGIMQIVWALWQVRPPRPPFTVRLSAGMALSGGVIVLWLLTHAVSTPFASAHHPIDAWAIVTKTLEAVSLTLLVAVALLNAPTVTRRAVSLGSAALVATFAGGIVWAGGMVSTPLLPMLAEAEGHTHDHAGHMHGVPQSVAQTRSTAAYFSIVNAGRTADTLTGVSGTGVGSITLHQTTIDDRAIMRMRDLLAIPLTPHVRVDFSPLGNHIMLDDLERDLFEGDVLPLTLHFASGRSAAVDFPVFLLTPEGRINFARVGDFQISNAWVRATASPDGRVRVSDGAYTWNLPPGFPPPRVPENNPMTQEKVDLGRYLFYDPALSGNGTQSCSTCHLQHLAFTDGLARSIGSTGEVHPRNAMTLTNAAYNASQTWANPSLTTLERQIPIPMFGEHPVELGITGNEAVVLGRLRQDERYRTMFAAAFPDQDDPITLSNAMLSLASFTRTLISGDSPYDRYLRGDASALSESAMRGMEIFFSEDLECHHCHTGFNFTLSTVNANSTFDERPFFNTGLYNIGGTGAYPPDNTGVHEITNLAADMGRFRPPTLRNIALTAPYMHDGSIATLEEVIRFYADGGRVITEGEYAGDGRRNPFKSGLVPGFTITEQQLDDLIAFLESLTDQAFITDPRLSDPFVSSDRTLNLSPSG
jgi:cytochrome c peroxidase